MNTVNSNGKAFNWDRGPLLVAAAFIVLVALIILL
jgi:hypothetical protein